MVRMGDGSRQKTPASAPIVAIQSVGRTPIDAPSAPPGVPPSGRTPA